MPCCGWQTPTPTRPRRSEPVTVPAALLTCGVDEAGRGPLAGPVVAAAVVLAGPIAGLADSKKLGAFTRESLATVIRQQARAWALGRAEAGEIDRYNIHHASLLAMRRAIDALRLIPGPGQPEEVLVDGRFCPPELSLPCRAVVRGDASVPAISAASILAKVARDAELNELEHRWPGYGFARHKGYPTPEHRQALLRLGPCPEHRLSYRPVAEAARAHGART